MMGPTVSKTQIEVRRSKMSQQNKSCTFCLLNAAIRSIFFAFPRTWSSSSVCSDRWCLYSSHFVSCLCSHSWQVAADLSFGEILIQPSLEIMGVCSPWEALLMTSLLVVAGRRRVGFCLCPSHVPQGQSVCLCSLLLLIRIFWHQFLT